MLILERWRPRLTNVGDLHVACDPGWNGLILETIDAVKPDGRFKSFKIRQIKEKFGGLRIYTFGASLGAIARAAVAHLRDLRSARDD